ncbi:hypothetical protein EBR43_13980 [bacterium]|nr:hypothetical protein [bacterium]
MISLPKNSFQTVQGGFSAQKIDEGLYKINGRYVDFMHPRIPVTIYDDLHSDLRESSNVPTVSIFVLSIISSICISSIYYSI